MSFTSLNLGSIASLTSYAFFKDGEDKISSTFSLSKPLKLVGDTNPWYTLLKSLYVLWKVSLASFKTFCNLLISESAAVDKGYFCFKFSLLFKSSPATSNALAGLTFIFLEISSPITGKDSTSSFIVILSFSIPPVSVKSFTNCSKTVVSISIPLIVFAFSNSFK